MKKKILNNLGLKILSVVFAILLWIVVMNVSDALVTEKITNIPVEILNDDVLDQLDKVYYIQKGETVDIVVKGKRSVVEKLSASDFKATADLSQMSITDTVQIMVDAVDSGVSKEVTITCVDNTMALSLEEKVSRQFPIKVSVKGAPKDGYAVGDISSTPNIVTVEGPESAVNKIVEIGALVNVAGLDSDSTTTCDITVYDAYGDELNNENVSVSQEQVDVTVKIYPKKTVPVNISVKDSPGLGYEISEVNYEPKNVVITGPEDDISDIESIDVDNLSVAGLTDNYETTIDINQYLPDGVVAAEDSGDVVVSVVIEKVIEKKLTVTASDIELKNTDSSYDYGLELSSDFGISVSGLEEYVDHMTLKDLTPYIDCTDLQTGDNYNVSLEFTENDNVEVQITGSIEVEVSEKK
jgi:YbbR domain-containing protein